MSKVTLLIVTSLICVFTEALVFAPEGTKAKSEEKLVPTVEMPVGDLAVGIINAKDFWCDWR